MQTLSPPKQQYNGNRFLAPLTVVSLFLGVAFGLLSNRATVAQAQAEHCVSDCDFACTNEEDPWYGSDGIWMTVHAIPTNTTTGSAAIWKDLSPDSWAPMWVEGSWSSGTTTVTALVKVQDNGTCDETGDPNDRIRCHDEVGTTAEFLCDSFSGVWDRVSAGVSNCLSEFTYGIDFQKTFMVSLEEFCFVSAKITTKKPQWEGVSSTRGLKARANCVTSSNLTYQNDTQAVEFTCQELSIQRPAGSVERLDVTVFWHY